MESLKARLVAALNARTHFLLADVACLDIVSDIPI